MACTTKSRLPQAFFTLSNTASMVVGLGHVAMADDDAVDLLGQRFHPLLQGVALIGEGEIGAMVAAGPRDAPGNRPVIGDPHDEAALAAHQTRPVSHS